MESCGHLNNGNDWRTPEVVFHDIKSMYPNIARSAQIDKCRYCHRDACTKAFVGFRMRRVCWDCRWKFDSRKMFNESIKR
jgi:hypothetical protein